MTISVTPLVDDSAKIYFYTKSQKVKWNIRGLIKSDALILFNTKTHDHIRCCASDIITVTTSTLYEPREVS